MKKSLLGISILLIAIIAVGTVSAFDLGSLFGGDADKNQTVTIDGIDFNVPAGFTEDKKEEIVNKQKNISDIDYVTNGKVYEKNDTCVALLVADYGDYNVTDDVIKNLGGDAKTLNNVSGYLTTDGNYTVFSYAKNNKLAVISTNDENVIADFIVP